MDARTADAAHAQVQITAGGLVDVAGALLVDTVAMADAGGLGGLLSTTASGSVGAPSVPVRYKAL